MLLKMLLEASEVFSRQAARDWELNNLDGNISPFQK
jgi:hypothetical protein